MGSAASGPGSSFVMLGKRWNGKNKQSGQS
jgi:hypothetical protein